MLGINLNISMADILSPLGAFLSQYVTPTNNHQHWLLVENYAGEFSFSVLSLCCKVEKINLVSQEIDHYNAKIFHEKENANFSQCFSPRITPNKER